MKILIPKPITAAMIAAGTTIAEPAAGETLWVANTAYALGDRRIRSETHRVYECVQAHSGRTALPESDGAYWLDRGPTQRWAPFDHYASTAATAVQTLTYVLKPGFANALALYGIDAGQVSLTVRAGTGGAVLYQSSGPVYQSTCSYYGYYFLPWRRRDRMVFDQLPIHPDAEITIALTAAAGVNVSLGMIVAGDYRPLIGENSAWGGTEAGASVEPVTYSYIKTEDDGTNVIKRRGSAKTMRINVKMPRRNLDQAIEALTSVLDVPCAFVGSDKPGFDGLNTFGLGSARAIYDSAAVGTMEITVKGSI